MNFFRNTKNYASSKGKEGAATANKETNKSIAKDRNVGWFTRMRAGGNAMGNKLDEQQHKREGKVHKQKLKHNY